MTRGAKVFSVSTVDMHLLIVTVLLLWLGQAMGEDRVPGHRRGPAIGQDRTSSGGGRIPGHRGI